MRSRLLVLALGAAVLLGGCTRAVAQGPDQAPAPAVKPPVPPAAAAGGACKRLDYDVIAGVLDVRFDVAAATVRDKTLTCVLQAMDASLPDLTLSVTPSTVDAAIFTQAVMPERARKLPDLGGAAYRIAVKPGKGHGPGVEIGWLSRGRALMILRYTMPAKASTAAAKATGEKLLTLAKMLEAATPPVKAPPVKRR